MMLLAIETATAAGGVALLKEGNPFAESWEDSPVNYSERLLPGIDRIVRKAGARPSDIDLVAVSVGPGSFTALRIGVSVAKSLSFGLGVPLIGVPTLDALAMRAGHQEDVTVCPVIDARRGEVYFALYRRGERLSEYQCAPIDTLLEQAAGPLLFLGDGALAHRENIIEKLGEAARFAPDESILPHPAATGRLGWKLFHSGGASDPADVSTIYLRQGANRIR